MKHTLISRDSKGKCRVIYISCDFDEDAQLYRISRSSGLLNGKLISQPELLITKGKVKRTLKEQADLEYNSIVKKYLDKGYKEVDLSVTELTEDVINEILPQDKTDQKGALKHMLAKLLDKTNKTLTDKLYAASYKLDGVRCSLFLKDGEVRTASRGGQDYDIPATYIRTDDYIVKVLTSNPNLILDGEIYRHGWPLSKISGLCRKETLEEEHKELRFYCYDIIDESKTFRERNEVLKTIRQDCPQDSKLLVVNHYRVQGLDQIMKLHNKAVSEGYEGLVVRDPDQTYKCGGRDNRMLKIKEFMDDEFEICGIAEGLRDEDMCFLMKTKEGYSFKAKPIGTREDKQWYRDHIKELIGRKGTVKYFGFTNTENPVPNLPVFKSLRTPEDE